MDKKNSLKVLVVEDHSFQLEYITNCLNQIGVDQIVTATDGVEALANMDDEEKSDQQIEVVICDLQMPNMDGIAFIRHLAERNYNGSLIILTGMDASLVSSVTQMVKEYQLKLIGCLYKPVNTKSLISYIAEASKDKGASIERPLPEGVNESDLISALEKGGLTPYFQPKFNFVDHSLVGVEALARLILPNQKVITPDNFLYLYDKLNKTKEFELQVYDQAFHLIKARMDAGHPVQLSINISANMLADSDFYEAILGLINWHSIPTDLITLELTERTLIYNLAMAIEYLSRLRLNGFNLAIDDFGTGYSSFKQLELLPFNELKIDKSFVIGMESDHQKQAIVQSIVELAQRLNIPTVAEGVETQEVWILAKQYGCEICQGYLTGKPLPREEVELFFR